MLNGFGKHRRRRTSLLAKAAKKCKGKRKFKSCVRGYIAKHRKSRRS